MVAGDPVMCIVCSAFEHGFLFSTSVGPVRATGMEGTAGWRIEGIRKFGLGIFRG